MEFFGIYTQETKLWVDLFTSPPRVDRTQETLGFNGLASKVAKNSIEMQRITY